jgi:hypothetical protein
MSPPNNDENVRTPHHFEPFKKMSLKKKICFVTFSRWISEVPLLVEALILR